MNRIHALEIVRLRVVPGRHARRATPTTCARRARCFRIFDTRQPWLLNVRRNRGHPRRDLCSQRRAALVLLEALERLDGRKVDAVAHR